MLQDAEYRRRLRIPPEGVLAGQQVIHHHAGRIEIALRRGFVAPQQLRCREPELTLEDAGSSGQLTALLHASDAEIVQLYLGSPIEQDVGERDVAMHDIGESTVGTTHVVSVL